MTGADTRHCLLPSGGAEGGFGGAVSRRRFLMGLGLLAGAGAAAPLLGRLGRPTAETVEVSRPALGTWARIVARDPDRGRATAAIERAYAAIARVDAQMSVHRADSELSRVNAAAGSAVAPAGADLIEVVERARAAAERSGGIYDPTVLPLMRAYGFYAPAGATPARYPDDRALERALACMGWRRIAIERAGAGAQGTLGLECAGAGLDLGSIGKGWAVDRAADALRASGIRSGLVDIGGNVYGLGTPGDGGEGWAVGVLHPLTHQVDRVFVLRDAAVATSGNYEQYRILSGLRVGHLFDARHGRPADGHLSASVQARTGVESDVMSTSAFLLGPDAFRDWPGAQLAHFIG
jgi:thiamine biosynthesis lipoprotein